MVVESIGRYRLLARLASGNMGEVFLAQYTGEAGFRRRVVVKRLFSHLASHPEAVRMFQEEAHALSMLSHPGIPQVYDLGFSDGHWFVVLEHVEGHTLAELCTAGALAGAAIPLEATISVIEQLCDALHHAHERCDPDGRPLRIVHRDVTPHNVMVTADGYTKLLDFGVVKTAWQDSSDGTVRGTLAYMSPEQVRGQRLDKRSDVFSVGVTLYELTTGRRLFVGNDVDVMTAIVERDVVPPSELIEGYPPELERLVSTALARDRTRRWPSALHLARALEDYASSLGLVATHQSLARYYCEAFSETEKASRALSSYRPMPIQGGGMPSRPPSAPLAKAGRELADLEALRVAPPPADRPQAEDAPAPLSLPRSDEMIVEEQPLMLVHPKRGA